MLLTSGIVKRYIDQSWSIEKIIQEAPPVTWEHVFNNAKQELYNISIILDKKEKDYGQYYPLKQDIFAAFDYTTLNNVKVIIIGQDPYYQTININGIFMPRAVGLAFSVRREDTIPVSLKNIYKELADTVEGFITPDHGDLREWTTQGVFLLNKCLTVQPGSPNSHDDIWLPFISKVFEIISIINPHCIFMLWGREAQKVKPMLGKYSVILEAAHPSGFSAAHGFFGCNHFNLANEALKKQGKKEINWKISKLKDLIATVSQNSTNSDGTPKRVFNQNILSTPFLINPINQTTNTYIPITSKRSTNYDIYQPTLQNTYVPTIPKPPVNYDTYQPTLQNTYIPTIPKQPINYNIYQPTLQHEKIYIPKPPVNYNIYQSI